jgi:hypothetical protein
MGMSIKKQKNLAGVHRWVQPFGKDHQALTAKSIIE